MTLTLEQWNEILDVVNPNKSDIFEQIKEDLKKQDKGTYQRWEQKGFDVDHLFDVSLYMVSNELTLLHIATLNGKLEIVKYLIKEKNVDVNVKDNYNATPLHNAVANGKLEMVKALLENKADVNVENTYGDTPLHEAAFSNRLEIVKKALVNHIAKLETIDSYVSEKNLQKRNELINASRERNNNYLQHLQICKKEVRKIKARNESLYDFLRENDVNKMTDIWEQNENLRNEFDNGENLKKLCPEYAHILMNKANEAKKEIFLNNHILLINILSKNYGEDFQKMSFTGIKNFFMSHRNDFNDIEQKTGVTLMNCLDFEDVKERHIPKLKVQVRTFVEMIKNKGIDSNLKNISTEQLQTLKRALN